MLRIENVVLMCIPSTDYTLQFCKPSFERLAYPYWILLWLGVKGKKGKANKPKCRWQYGGDIPLRMGEVSSLPKYCTGERVL